MATTIHPIFDERPSITSADLADDERREGILRCMFEHEKARGNYSNYGVIRTFVEAAGGKYGLVLFSGSLSTSMVIFPSFFWYGVRGELLCRGDDAASGSPSRVVAVVSYGSADVLAMPRTVWRFLAETERGKEGKGRDRW